MNMRYLNFLITLALLLAMHACKKDSANNTGNQPVTLFSSKFDKQADLSLWTQSAGGQAIIDSSAVKFTNLTSCFQLETSSLIPVQKGKTYDLKLTGKVNPAMPGDPVLCAGNFLIYVVQGNSYLISASFGNYPSWTQRSFSFEATSSASVTIKILVGTTRGAWIDNLEFIEH